MSTGTIYTEGVPDDLDASHIVAGTGGTYVAVPRLASSYLVTVGIVLVIVFCFILIAFAFYWSDLNATVEVVVPDVPKFPAPVDLVPGRGPTTAIAYTSSFDGTSLTSETACVTAPNTSGWQTPANVCQCAAPYWGGECQRESYAPRYISAGYLTDPATQITLTGANVSTTTYLSYTEEVGSTACTVTCDNIGPSCIGVLWDGVTKSCTTFSGATLAAGVRPVFNPSVDSNLYLNTWQLGLTDEVVIFSGSRPSIDSWWETGAGPDFQLAKKGLRYRLNFFPEGVYQGPTSGSSMTGLYSRLPFDPSEFAARVAAGSNADFYVVPPGTSPLLVPINWGNFLPIWVMYDDASV